MVKAGFIKKVTSEQRPEKTEEVNQVENSGGGSPDIQIKKEALLTLRTNKGVGEVAAERELGEEGTVGEETLEIKVGESINHEDPLLL